MGDIVYDEFQDIVNTTTGVFGGEALDEHHRVKAVPQAQGVLLEFTCQGCNAGIQLTLEWPEVIALKYGVDPALAFRGRQDIVGAPMSFAYKREEHAWMPNAKCDRCQFYYGIRVYPNEPEGWLQSGRQAALVPQAAEAQLSAFVAQVAQAIRGAAGAAPRR